MPKEATRTGELVGMYLSKVPLELKRALETEALRRRHSGENATISGLVTEALSEWHERINQAGHHQAAATDSK